MLANARSLSLSPRVDLELYPEPTIADRNFRGQKRDKRQKEGSAESQRFLLHDNARPNTARVTQNLLVSFGWDIVTHTRYSPDLAPSDFHLFIKMKEWGYDRLKKAGQPVRSPRSEIMSVNIRKGIVTAVFNPEFAESNKFRLILGGGIEGTTHVEESTPQKMATIRKRFRSTNSEQ
ncbi:hypothetical protein AAG570_000112 [Ranatra chinensis]|uniref:Histone-lysine N-methyltransferase SETMAR n=1 Tax=Ranatra chinensis TaxID=642074 RepID=A0ABD0YW46_9HEMI